jgi:aspartyl-tRNA(Asn)/glutamyl-tRNA(Gln) amidotransferase subunit A
VTALADGELETAAEAIAAIRRGEVGASELVERSVHRAEAWQPATRAFSQLWADDAMAEARRMDALSSAARPAVPLPLAVKDLYDVAGRETTGCCAAYRGNVASSDAPIVARLRAAGLVFVGKTNQHELAAGGSNTVSACGRTGNPWDPERITGGSSGGSGAAVAARVVPWALGSDTGGSIRIPASMCGTFGLKPTWGRLPLEGLMPLAPTMDCPGPMAATASDLWTLFLLMAGEDPAPLPDLPGSGGGPVRVAVPVRGFFWDRIHGAVKATLEAVATTLEGAGASLREVDGAGIGDARSVWMRVCTPEFAQAHPLLRDRRDRVAPQVVEWLEMGERLGADESAEAAGRRLEITAWFDSRLQDVDSLLIPTTPYPAPRADQREVDLGGRRTVDTAEVGPGWITCSVNLAGLPAVNLPAGRSPEGLPIGVTLVGRANSEQSLVSIAALWEQAAGYRLVPPPRRPPN